MQWKNRYGRTMKYSTGFEGVMPYIERKYLEAESDWSQQRYGEYLREIPCPVCDGQAAQARGARGARSPATASRRSPS